ncbi:unnamed protein product [Orchesella dallaii]|uniref:Uncharacterized protein n=1 Tax=Orchesella dallaii TaxID=48710 RepID=A0ABP1S7V3_9HEXA
MELAVRKNLNEQRNMFIHGYQENIIRFTVAVINTMKSYRRIGRSRGNLRHQGDPYMSTTWIPYQTPPPSPSSPLRTWMDVLLDSPTLTLHQNELRFPGSLFNLFLQILHLIKLLCPIRSALKASLVVRDVRFKASTLSKCAIADKYALVPALQNDLPPPSQRQDLPPPKQPLPPPLQKDLPPPSPRQDLPPPHQPLPSRFLQPLAHHPHDKIYHLNSNLYHHVPYNIYLYHPHDKIYHLNNNLYHHHIHDKIYHFQNKLYHQGPYNLYHPDHKLCCLQNKLYQFHIPLYHYVYHYFEIYPHFSCS